MHRTVQEFRGKIYHSKGEAKYAQDLQLRQWAGDIKEVIPQFKLSLDVNDLHICNYIVDFLVINKDGSKELHEFKGFETTLWKIKWRLTEALYGKKYKMVVIH